MYFISEIIAQVESSFYQDDKLLCYAKLDVDSYPPQKFTISATVFGDPPGLYFYIL